jgi:hypothetical protein
MTANTLDIYGELFGILAGAGILLLFGITAALPHLSGVLAARRSHRQSSRADSEHMEAESEQGGEIVKPDGYIDSFGGIIEEAGGDLPPVVRIALWGVLLWWLIYLILFWTPKGFPYVV